MRWFGDFFLLLLAAGAAWAVVRTFADVFATKHKGRMP
jgi:hypothetical protein